MERNEYKPLPAPPRVFTRWHAIQLPPNILVAIYATYAEIWWLTILSVTATVCQLLLVYVRYTVLRKLHRQLRTLKKIGETPMFRTEGNTIVFTYLIPNELKQTFCNIYRAGE